MGRFIFAILILLFCAAPAFAWVDPVFACNPQNFLLRRTADGFTLFGNLDTAFPGYGYEIAPVTGVGDGNGETTLTLLPPGGAVPVRPSHVSLNRPFLSAAWPVSHLIVHIDGGARYAGPIQIECYQHGGSQ